MATYIIDMEKAHKLSVRNKLWTVLNDIIYVDDSIYCLGTL
jgi:hypothetical protein